MWPQPAPRADPPGASAASAFPFAATQPRPSRSAQPRSGGPERVKRWRRDQIHFSPERARAVRRAPARPEWSVASDAEGGTRRAVRAGTYTPANRWRALTQQQNRGGTEGADRSSCPGDASTAGTRRAASRDRRAVGGFRGDRTCR